MDFTKIKEILEGANLNEEQVKALDGFFEDVVEKIRKEERSKQTSFNESNEEMISKKVAELAFENFKKDSKVAFELFQEDAKKSYSLFREDAQKAFELYAEDLQNQYSENFVKALHDVYVDVSERAKRDFMESGDAKILGDIKQIVSPIVVGSNSKQLLEEINQLKKEKEMILEESKKVSRESIIQSLVSDFPKEYAETAYEFINGAETEDQIYERFSSFCEMAKCFSGKPIVEEKTTKKPTQKEIVEECSTKKKEEKPTQKKPVEKPKPKRIITEELDKPTLQTKTQEKSSSKPEEKLFSKEEEELLGLVI